MATSDGEGFESPDEGNPVLTTEMRNALNETTTLSTEQLKIGAALRQAWRMTKPYFMESERKNKARLLMSGVAGVTAGQVGLAIWMNSWRGGFWDALADKDPAAFGWSLGEFALVGGLWIAGNVYREYLQGLLQVDWRDWMTKDMKDRWLTGKTAYHIQKSGDPMASPDQRLTTDIVDFVWKTHSLSMSFLNATMSFGLFASILWTKGGALDFSMAGNEYSIPGYMMGVAAIYAMAGTWAIHKIGKDLPIIHTFRERYEQDLRYALVRMRENAEQIAMFDGEQRESETLNRKFNKLVGNLYTMVNKNRHLSWLSQSLGTVYEVVPLVAAAPQLFSGKMSIGGMHEVAGAFGHVVGSLSWAVSAYPQLAEYKATISRLAQFEGEIEKYNTRVSETLHREIKHDEDGPSCFRLTDLSLFKPGTEEALFEPFSLTLNPGDRLALTGVVGSGKSTILRAVCGTMDEGEGDIEVVSKTRVLCIPQKTYMPLESLRGVICYPGSPDDFTEEQIMEAMTAAGIAHYAPLLDDESKEGNYWASALSGGEQQRVGFARVFLHKPDILMLDEATSSMDSHAEQDMYERVIDKLPDTIMISIAHREKVLEFHTRHAHIEEQRLNYPAPMIPPRPPAMPGP